MQRHVHTKQGRELLVDADGRDVVHAGGREGAVGSLDEAKVAHVLQPRAVAGVRADGKYRLVGVVDVDTLEAVGKPGNLRQSAIAHRPVGQHARQGREQVERAARAAGIGSKEGRYEHIGRILVDGIHGSGNTGI